MKRKKKRNQKGFMLVETLITTVFVVSIVVLLYTNILPLIGEYDRYKNYDSVEATYMAHWARRFVLDGLSEAAYTNASSIGYLGITNSSYMESSRYRDLFENFKEVNGITRVYLTPYQTDKIKGIKDTFPRNFEEYLSYLPSYEKNTSKTAATGYYSVIIEYCGIDNVANCGNNHKYGTIEVRK